MNPIGAECHDRSCKECPCPGLLDCAHQMSTRESVIEELESIERTLDRYSEDSSFRWGEPATNSPQINVLYEGTSIPPVIEGLIVRQDSVVSSIQTEHPLWMKIVIRPRR